MSLNERLKDAVIMAPMTKGGNAPYRRLCQFFGATLTMGEMALARQLLKGVRSEMALIRRGPDEKFFGVQLAGNDPAEMAEAAKLVEGKGADLIDLNCGCPIDLMTRRGLGSALLQRPSKLKRIVEAMAQAVKIPVTVKIRLGWSDNDLNYLPNSKAAVEGGAQAVTVHGRTRTQRYRKNAVWEAVGEVAAVVPVPVIGNGDILFAKDIRDFRARAGKCAGVMIARGALIKPWIFREAATGIDGDLTPAERLAIYRQYADYSREHFGKDEHGTKRVRDFLLWHLGFWCRYVPRRPDGSYPGMQEREEHFAPRSELEGLFARNDAPALEWMATLILDGEEKAGAAPPKPAAETERELIPEG